MLVFRGKWRYKNIHLYKIQSATSYSLYRAFHFSLFCEIWLESASNCLNTFLHILWWIYRFTNQSNFQQQQSHLLETWSYLATWASFGPSCCCCCCCFCSWMKNQTTTVASVTDLRKKTKMLTNYNSTQWIISKWRCKQNYFLKYSCPTPVSDLGSSSWCGWIG